jgi:hypothetical protein
MEIRKEAVWAATFSPVAPDRHMEYVVSVNGIQALCNVLQNQSDATLLLAVMDAFEKSSWTPTTKQAQLSSHDGRVVGVDHLEELRQHPNNDVFEKQATSLSSTLEARDDEDRTCSRNRGRDIHLCILRKSSSRQKTTLLESVSTLEDELLTLLQEV